jgi:hypothetical protein
MTLMVVSDVAGVAAVASLAAVASARGRFRAVLPSVLCAVVVYGGWLLWQEPWASRVDGLSLDTVIRVPEAAWAMLGGAVSQALALPASYGPVLGVVLVGSLALWGVRGRLTTFDYVWVATAALYVVAVALTTPDPARFDPLAEPHAFALAWLLVPAAVPHITAGEGTPRVVVLSVAAVLVIAGSFHTLDASLDAAEQTTTESRRHIEAVAELLLNGEPAVGSSLLDVPGDGGPMDGRLTVDGVAGMLAAGWPADELVDGEDEDTEIDENARGTLRMAVEPGAAGAACTPMERSLTVATAEYPDGLVLRPSEPVAVRLRFTDDLGIGRRVERVAGTVLIRYPDAAPGEVRVSPVGPFTALEVCTPAGEG